WQTAEDFSDRRRIRARMYRLREQRLREMMQNDEESLGTLNITDDGGITERSETTISVSDDGKTTSRRSSNIQVTMHVDGDSAVTDSISTQNVRLGGLTMRGVDTVSVDADEIINERIRKASKDRTTRYQQIIGGLSDTDGNSDGEAVVSITKSTYSIQSNALAGEGYISMKNKEVRDSVSPTRILRERRSSAEDDTANEGRLTSDDEAALKAESENVIKAIETSAPKTSSSRKTSREERKSTTKTSKAKSEIPIRKESTRKVSERKISRELDLSSNRRATGDKSSPTSPTKRTPSESSSKTHLSRRTGAQRESSSASSKVPSKSDVKSSSTTKKSKLDEIEAKMESSIMSELSKLDSYLKGAEDDDDEVIMEEEEDCVDEAGNVVKMLVQTRRKKDGTECTARRVARSTKIVNSESEIDEILIGNPDHEVIERNVAEEEDKEGNKIKIITETRKRPDGITYTTKNILKTSKIFDYDHPEDVAYNEEDELISTNETEEMDENGCTIQTVTETRRKANGIEYTTKKVYKTSKVKSTQITPSDDDEVIDTRENEEKKDDGSIIRTVIETRRTKNGEEYTHRQVFKSRRMTLSGVDLQQGLPTVQNDDEVLNKSEKEETDENGMRVRIVTETRRRKDGSTYSFDYVLRSFQGTEEDVMKIPVSASSSSNIAVCAEDELLNEEVKEELQEDGSTVKTVIERRRAKDSTEYLRHRVMRIPKMPEPVLQVGNLEDEILQEEVNEETLDDGTQYKAVTERRRSSVSGLQYTLRRMSRVYQHATHHPKGIEDEILDENVVEEETDDGTIIKTVVQRYQRPDGSIYTTHNIQKMFSTPAPVTFVGTENDELIDQSVDEQETEDGYVIKTVTETRRRADGVQYTVERAEKSTKYGPQVHITFNTNQKPEEVVQVGSADDTVISTEEQEYEEEDGTVVKTTIEIRRRVDGSEYTAKTVMRSTPVLVPERETSYVIIKPEKDDDDDGSSLFPSLDDELVYTRKREEKDEDGNPITVIIETRQSRVTGEKYNITKRVHTKDVLMTEEGEKEIPKKTVKSTLVANLTLSRPEHRKSTSAQPQVENDDVPYGSVSALKNRFAPGNKKTNASPKSFKPERSSTSNKKKFFEEAAKEAAGKTTTSAKSYSSKPLKIRKETEGFSVPEDKASIEVKLRVGEEKAKVEDVSAHNVTYQPDAIPKEMMENIMKSGNCEDTVKEMDEKEPFSETESVKESFDQSEPTLDDSLQGEEPVEMQPKKVVEKRKSSPLSKGSEEKMKRRPDQSPPKKPDTSRRVKNNPLKDDSPPRRVLPQKEPIAPRESGKKAPKPNTSPQRVANSPRRGRSPNRSGLSTPREVTPTGRQCCKRHRDTNAPETVSPTRTQKTTRAAPLPSKKVGSPEGKPRVNGDVRRSAEPKVNGDINRKSDDRTARARRAPDRSSEVEKTSGRPSRVSQSPTKKSPPSRSPDKREPAKSLTSKTGDKKTPTITPVTNGKDKPKGSLYLEPVDPIVSMPETPMTEDMKLLQQDKDVLIEDVSNEPDLPYHSIHRPSLVREPSEYQPPEANDKDLLDIQSEESPAGKEPLQEDVSKSRKPKPLESRPSDKSLTSKKQPETKRPARDRPWLSEKRNSFEKKLSETKLTAEKKKVFERKPSDDKLKKTKDEQKLKKSSAQELDEENIKNGNLVNRDTLSSKELKENIDKVQRKVEEISSRYLEDVEKSLSSQIIPDKNITTTDLSARRSAFHRAASTEKKDVPRRKPSYEMKESVFSKRSMFEQPKNDSASVPVKRSPVKSTIKSDDFYKKQTEEQKSHLNKKTEERIPVEEPLITPKYIHPLGEEDEEERKLNEKVIEEEVKVSSSELVQAVAAETFKISKEYNHETIVAEETSTLPYRKESSSSQYLEESSPVPGSKEGSPAPFSKEGSPSRFTTGKPVDSGINANKIRRIERTASNKKLFEDLEVSRDLLPEYIKNIDNIVDVALLESMLEQAESYEERRIIRGQLRIAKKQSTTILSTSSTPSYKRFIEPSPSRPSPTASPQTKRHDEVKPTRSEEPKEKSQKPLSKSEEPSSSNQDQSDSSTTRKTSTTNHDSWEDELYEESTMVTSRTHETSSSLRKKSEKETTPEPEEIKISPRIEKRDSKKSLKPEEPRNRLGRNLTKEDSKKIDSPKSDKMEPLSTKSTPSNEPYSEPLRYQKKQGSTPSKPSTAQSHVDTIVSAYGVGPTDDNGMPLFGLRALKKRSPPATSDDTPSEEVKSAPSEKEPLPVQEEKAKQEYEPTDASGQPIFGLRALKKATSSITATERAVDTDALETTETASSSVESSHLVSGIVTRRQTHAKETSPGLVRSLRDSFKRRDTAEELQTTGKAEDEVITKRSQPLRDILKLHEAKVQEPAAVVESPRLKPKQRLRENFEVPERQDSRVKTWDLESDLSTRSQDMKNIIAHHETITSDSAPKPEKKLTGILKKTSSTNILGSDKTSSTTTERTAVAETRVNTSLSEQLNTTDDILDTLTEDQITQLSKEFDLRAQDDGVIKTEESIEELTGGYRVSRRTEGEYPDGAKFERKTSYTEIKLQQPNNEERSRDLRKPDFDLKDSTLPKSADRLTHSSLSKAQASTVGSQVDETVIESVIQSVRETSVKRKISVEQAVRDKTKVLECTDRFRSVNKLDKQNYPSERKLKQLNAFKEGKIPTADEAKENKVGDTNVEMQKPVTNKQKSASVSSAGREKSKVKPLQMHSNETNTKTTSKSGMSGKPKSSSKHPIDDSKIVSNIARKPSVTYSSISNKNDSETVSVRKSERILKEKSDKVEQEGGDKKTKKSGKGSYSLERDSSKEIKATLSGDSSTFEDTTKSTSGGSTSSESKYILQTSRNIIAEYVEASKKSSTKHLSTTVEEFNTSKDEDSQLKRVRKKSQPDREDMNSIVRKTGDILDNKLETKTKMSPEDKCKGINIQSYKRCEAKPVVAKIDKITQKAGGKQYDGSSDCAVHKDSFRKGKFSSKSKRTKVEGHCEKQGEDVQPIMAKGFSRFKKESVHDNVKVASLTVSTTKSADTKTTCHFKSDDHLLESSTSEKVLKNIDSTKRSEDSKSSVAVASKIVEAPAESLSDKTEKNISKASRRSEKRDLLPKKIQTDTFVTDKPYNEELDVKSSEAKVQLSVSTNEEKAIGKLSRTLENIMKPEKEIKGDGIRSRVTGPENMTNVTITSRIDIKEINSKTERADVKICKRLCKNDNEIIVKEESLKVANSHNTVENKSDTGVDTSKLSKSTKDSKSSENLDSLSDKKDTADKKLEQRKRSPGRIGEKLKTAKISEDTEISKINAEKMVDSRSVSDFTLSKDSHIGKNLPNRSLESKQELVMHSETSVNIDKIGFITEAFVTKSSDHVTTVADTSEVKKEITLVVKEKTEKSQTSMINKSSKSRDQTATKPYVQSNKPEKPPAELTDKEQAENNSKKSLNDKEIERRSLVKHVGDTEQRKGRAVKSVDEKESRKNIPLSCVEAHDSLTKLSATSNDDRAQGDKSVIKSANIENSRKISPLRPAIVSLPAKKNIDIPGNEKTVEMSSPDKIIEEFERKKQTVVKPTNKNEPGKSALISDEQELKKENPSKSSAVQIPKKKIDEELQTSKSSDISVLGKELVKKSRVRSPARPANVKETDKKNPDRSADEQTLNKKIPPGKEAKEKNIVRSSDDHESRKKSPTKSDHAREPKKISPDRFPDEQNPKKEGQDGKEPDKERIVKSFGDNESRKKSPLRADHRKETDKRSPDRSDGEQNPKKKCLGGKEPEIFSHMKEQKEKCSDGLAEEQKAKKRGLDGKYQDSRKEEKNISPKKSSDAQEPVKKGTDGKEIEKDSIVSSENNEAKKKSPAISAHVKKPEEKNPDSSSDELKPKERDPNGKQSEKELIIKSDDHKPRKKSHSRHAHLNKPVKKSPDRSADEQEPKKIESHGKATETESIVVKSPDNHEPRKKSPTRSTPVKELKKKSSGRSSAKHEPEKSNSICPTDDREDINILESSCVEKQTVKKSPVRHEGDQKQSKKDIFMSVHDNDAAKKGQSVLSDNREPKKKDLVKPLNEQEPRKRNPVKSNVEKRPKKKSPIRCVEHESKDESLLRSAHEKDSIKETPNKPADNLETSPDQINDDSKSEKQSKKPEHVLKNSESIKKEECKKTDREKEGSSQTPKKNMEPKTRDISKVVAVKKQHIPKETLKPDVLSKDSLNIKDKTDMQDSSSTSGMPHRVTECMETEIVRVDSKEFLETEGAFYVSEEYDSDASSGDASSSMSSVSSESASEKAKLDKKKLTKKKSRKSKTIKEKHSTKRGITVLQKSIDVKVELLESETNKEIAHKHKNIKLEKKSNDTKDNKENISDMRSFRTEPETRPTSSPNPSDSETKKKAHNILARETKRPCHVSAKKICAEVETGLTISPNPSDSDTHQRSDAMLKKVRKPLDGKKLPSPSSKLHDESETCLTSSPNPSDCESKMKKSVSSLKKTKKPYDDSNEKRLKSAREDVEEREAGQISSPNPSDNDTKKRTKRPCRKAVVKDSHSTRLLDESGNFSVKTVNSKDKDSAILDTGNETIREKEKICGILDNKTHEIASRERKMDQPKENEPLNIGTDTKTLVDRQFENDIKAKAKSEDFVTLETPKLDRGTSDTQKESENASKTREVQEKGDFEESVKPKPLIEKKSLQNRPDSRLEPTKILEESNRGAEVLEEPKLEEDRVQKEIIPKKSDDKQERGLSLKKKSFIPVAEVTIQPDITDIEKNIAHKPSHIPVPITSAHTPEVVLPATVNTRERKSVSPERKSLLPLPCDFLKLHECTNEASKMQVKTWEYMPNQNARTRGKDDDPYHTKTVSEHVKKIEDTISKMAEIPEKSIRKTGSQGKEAERAPVSKVSHPCSDTVLDSLEKDPNKAETGTHGKSVKPEEILQIYQKPSDSGDKVESLANEGIPVIDTKVPIILLRNREIDNRKDMSFESSKSYVTNVTEEIHSNIENMERDEITKPKMDEDTTDKMTNITKNDTPRRKAGLHDKEEKSLERALVPPQGETISKMKTVCKKLVFPEIDISKRQASTPSKLMDKSDIVNVPGPDIIAMKDKCKPDKVDDDDLKESAAKGKSDTMENKDTIVKKYCPKDDGEITLSEEKVKREKRSSVKSRKRLEIEEDNISERPIGKAKKKREPHNICLISDAGAPVNEKLTESGKPTNKTNLSTSIIDSSSTVPLDSSDLKKHVNLTPKSTDMNTQKPYSHKKSRNAVQIELVKNRKTMDYLGGKLASDDYYKTTKTRKRHSQSDMDITKERSKVPESEDTKHLRKGSNKRKSSLDQNFPSHNISDGIETRTFSMQSLSGVSTTSSVPSYMRPRGESCSCRRHTPERDIQEIEESLLNAYKYTRCTKKVSKAPVTYHYTYAVAPDSGGGAGSYSIYFGPKGKSVPKGNIKSYMPGKTYTKSPSELDPVQQSANYVSSSTDESRNTVVTSTGVDGDSYKNTHGTVRGSHNTDQQLRKSEVPHSGEKDYSSNFEETDNKVEMTEKVLYLSHEESALSGKHVPRIHFTSTEDDTMFCAESLPLRNEESHHIDSTSQHVDTEHSTVKARETVDHLAKLQESTSYSETRQSQEHAVKSSQFEHTSQDEHRTHHEHTDENRFCSEMAKNDKQKISDQSFVLSEHHGTDKTHSTHITTEQAHLTQKASNEKKINDSHKSGSYIERKMSGDELIVNDSKQWKQLIELPATSITRGDYMVHKRDDSGNIVVGNGRYVTDRTSTSLDGHPADDPSSGYIRQEQDGDGSWREIGGKENHLTSSSLETQKQDQQKASSEHCVMSTVAEMSGQRWNQHHLQTKRQ
ncbi:hypothetical protein SK128_022566, partial [Halocaridina rubra]